MIIIALPFAGGNIYSYRNFENHIPSGFRWNTVELPGRGRRIHEDLIENIEDQVNDIFNQIVGIISDEEYVVYGHSMGGLLGYELTKKIVAKGLKTPLFLYFTGRSAPSIRINKKVSDFCRTEFWKEIESMGGIPKEVMSNRDFKDFIEPILRSDFKSIENYIYNLNGQHFSMSIPIYLRTGDKEKLNLNNVKAWQEETRKKINIKTLPGDHFFIYDHSKYIVEEIIEIYTSGKN